MQIGIARLLNRIFKNRPARRHSLVGPGDLWEMKRDFQISFLKQRGLEPTHRLLDIGCGTLRGGIPLIDYLDEGHYCGIEARSAVLEEGRRELRDSELQEKRPELICEADLSRVSLKQSFEYVWAFSVLIHMSDEHLDRCLSLVVKHIAPDGVFLGNVIVGDAGDGEWQGFPVVHRSQAFYEERCARQGLIATDLGSLEECGHVAGRGIQDSQRMLEIRAT